MTEPLVEVDQLAKNFGPIQAVSNVTFTVGHGEILGLMGPNGAGKTTTIRMLTGFIAPSSGSARIRGHDIQSEPTKAKRAIGYLPEGVPLYGDMSVENFLHFVASARAVPARERRSRFEDTVSKTSLTRVLHRPIKTLSKGYKRRVGLAQAIIHDPPVLVLDEPTDGLDPNQKHDVRMLLERMAHDKAIIMCTHLLEEVEAICTRTVIIARGRSIADATPETLRRQSIFHNAVRLSVAKENADKLTEQLRAISGVGGVDRIGETDRQTVLRIISANRKSILAPVRQAVQSSGAKVSEIMVESGRLEDLFRQLTLSV
ncbi:MAG: ABC transporter ATP-binding protein [Pseudomonadota bacterium]